MRKKLLVLILAVVIFGMGFLMGYSERSGLEETETGTIIMEAVLPEDPVKELQWELLEAEVTGKAIRGRGDTISYEAVLDVPGLVSGLRLPLDSIEYRVVSKGDVVDLMHISQGDETRYLQWWRDEVGKLKIHETRPIAVIDAGHGGIDNGQGGNGLWLEKDMNLDTSERMAEKLRQAGIHVIMTRTKEAYVSLYDRVAVANYVEADILVSNHMNRMDGETSGVEVLYSSHSDRSFANSLAEAISTEEHPVFRVYRRRSYDIPGLDYYFLHKYTEVPSYIIEYGFADNEGDAAYIYENWEGMVDRVAEVIVESLVD